VPAVARAFAAGEISPSGVELLASARATDAAAFDTSEEILVQAACALPIRQLAQAIGHWKRLVEAERDTDEHVSARSLHVSPTLGGMVRVDGDLDPETGQQLITALRSLTDVWAREPDDDRTAVQRRADALGEICRGFLDRSDRHVVAGERPHILVNVDLEVLEGRRGGRSTLEDVGPVSGEVARLLACDAGLTRVITRGSSEPLDVGRKTPIVPVSLRRAVVVRDGGCRFPGCDRSPGWCDAHHVRHWAGGGETSLTNLVLLCRPHHRRVHDGFQIEMVDGCPRFSRPDGTALDDRGPP